MAHLIESMAYAGAAPWHHLGSQLAPKQPIEVWARQAGMDWDICEAPVRYATEETGDAVLTFPEQKVLFRSDNKRALSVVSGRYQVVQPKAVLEFYRDLTEISGYELETAGVLKEGKKFWALARIGKESALKGGDLVKGYLLLATSCDGTLATTATPTTIRVVCNNTLTIALNEATAAVKVPHSTAFDAQAVKVRLGIAVSHWDEFMYRMKALSDRKVKGEESSKYFRKVLGIPEAHPQQEAVVAQERALKRVQELYEGQGRGAELSSAKGTVWGLLNAVTEYVDHERRARSQEYRLDSAWFGHGAAVKQRALDQALDLVS
jgi:phage/plasmid-like protein (TIGR03299 family)